MSELAIPDGPEALTAEWVTSALREGGVLEAGTSVRALRAEVIGADRGIGGQVARVALEYEGGPEAPRTLVAKFPSAIEVTRAGGRYMRLPEREVRLYRELAPVLPLRVPACHFSAIDEEGDAFVLLLEDLGSAKFGDDLEGASDAQLDAAVDALAALHAAFWGSPLPEALGWMPAIDERAGQWQRMFTVAWREATQAASAGEETGRELVAIVPEAAQDLVDRLTRSGRGAVKRLAASPATLLHGDFRLDNLCFDLPDGSPIAAIDWSNATRGPGPYDLAYLCCVGLSPERRRQREEGLLARYHALLLERGVEAYSLEDCRRDYALSYLEPLMRMFFLVARGHTAGGGDRATRVLSQVVRNAAEAALDLDAAALLEG
jgi:aminoglycoside phosphotransferase (APT) family kinase protein